MIDQETIGGEVSEGRKGRTTLILRYCIASKISIGNQDKLGHYAPLVANYGIES